MKRAPDAGAPSATRVAATGSLLSLQEVADREGLKTISAVRYEIRNGHLIAQDGLVTEEAYALWAAKRRARDTAWQLKPWNALQARLLAHVKDSDRTFKSVADEIGCSCVQTLYAWFEHKGRTLSERFIVGLARTLGIDPEIAKVEAGGTTAEERKRKTAIKNLEKVPKPGSKEFVETRARATAALRKTWETREWSDEERAKIAEGNRLAGSGDRGTAALRAYHDTGRARILSPLWQFIRWHGTQTRSVVNDWADEVAERLGVVRADVLREWKPYLENAGMWSNRGAPRKDAVRATLRDLLDQVIAELDNSIGLNELEARVGFEYWLRGGWPEYPAASSDHEDGYAPAYRANVVARVNRMIGPDCKKSLQAATTQFAA